MANQKLTDLTSATTPLSGSEQVYVVQSGASKKTTAQQLADVPGEWSGETVSQAEAEAGTATTRRAWTALRVFQAVAAWWAASSAKTKLDGIASGATANSSDATLLARANHTGTQAAGTITGLATVATTGAYSDLSGRPTLGTAASLDVAATGDATSGQVVKGNDSRLSDARTPTAHTQAASTISDSTAAGRALLTATDAAAQRTSLGLGSFATADPAAPPALGGTTPAAGSFTALTASTRLGLPSGAPASPAARDLYAVSDTLRYRDSGGGERLLLNASDNLANLASVATARTNLGLGTAATAASGDFLPTTFTAGTISYAATTDLDMTALAGGYRTLSLTGNITFTTSNRASGRTVVIRLICDSTQRTLTFPAGWVFVGSKPANIAASKTAVLSLTFFGSADTDCVAAYGVQS